MPPDTSRAPTWDSLIADVRSGPGSDARHNVGAWAMDRVRAALGETWPQRWHARHGRLPQFVADAANNALAYAQLVETGLRLERLAGTLRLKSLTNEWSRDPQEIRLLLALGGDDHVRGASSSSLNASAFTPTTTQPMLWCMTGTSGSAFT